MDISRFRPSARIEERRGEVLPGDYAQDLIRRSRAAWPRLPPGYTGVHFGDWPFTIPWVDPSDLSGPAGYDALLLLERGYQQMREPGFPDLKSREYKKRD